MATLLACDVVCVFWASAANADPRFGDSTWAAPAEMFDSIYTIDGPRVAPPDHERGWETALRTPFRVVFFPLRLVAMGLEATAGFVGPRFLAPKAQSSPKKGIAVAPYISLGAVNDISLGAGLTWTGFPIANSSLRLAGSWSTFSGRTLNFSETIGDRRPVSFRLRAAYEYKPNRRFYGIGNDTPASALSYFLLETTTAEAALLLGASPLRRVQIVGGYSSMSPGRGSHGEPLLEDVFAPASVPYAKQATQALWLGVTADYAALDDERDPSLGVRGRIDLRSAEGLRSVDPDYYQWRAEIRGYVPVFAKRRVITVHVLYTGVDATGSTTELPFYRLPESRGLSHFAGYGSERFRDQELILARIEYRWIILHRISLLGLYELGEVAPNAGSFTFRDAHKSYGGGLRLGLSDETALRFELASSAEGLHAYFGLGSDF